MSKGRGLQRVREIERTDIYNEYVARIGQIINGHVKRFERGDVIVDLGRDVEAILPRSQQSSAERWSQGELIRSLIINVQQRKGPLIDLSRTSPVLLRFLFEREVPEIDAGKVVIKAVARIPGERAKIAVMSTVSDLDPVEVCLGLKNSRVLQISRELRGEKIDVIEWSDELTVFAARALTPAKVNEVRVIDAEDRSLAVIVSEDQESLALGKRGLNVRLAAELVRGSIEIKPLNV